MSKTYKVSGMTCEGCAKALINAIKGVAPDAIVKVDLESDHISIEGLDDTSAIAAAVDDAGFEFGSAIALLKSITKGEIRRSILSHAMARANRAKTRALTKPPHSINLSGAKTISLIICM
jgi:copper chaperone|tara:strand:- start:646 stop:1005 length:360 start_codon:yes stop_codon:yes gene_type:complete